MNSGRTRKGVRHDSEEPVKGVAHDVEHVVQEAVRGRGTNDSYDDIIKSIANEASKSNPETEIEKSAREVREKYDVEFAKGRQNQFVIFKRISGVIFLLFSLIVIDAFLLKYNAGFTFSGLLDGLCTWTIYGLNQFGYYFGRFLNVWQLAWDAIDALWQIFKDFLPLKEFEIARQWWIRVLAKTGYLVVIGWLVEFFNGIKSSLTVEWQIGLLFSIPIIIYVLRKLFK